MPHLRQPVPFPPRSAPSPGAPGPRLTPLARDILVVLVVKAIVLYALWFAFFRMPAAPGMTMDTVIVEQRLVGPAARIEPSHER